MADPCPCPSEPSSISVASKGNSNKNDTWNEACDSKAEYNFLSFGTFASSSRANNEETDKNTREKKSEPRVFFCNFCKREYSSPQALGGHQNAHKQERALVKRRQAIGIGPYGHPYFPYYPYRSLSTHHTIYGSYNRALGVKMESMIHKPSQGWTLPGYRSGHGWSRQTLLNSATVNSLRMDDSHPYGGGGYGLLGKFSSLRLEEGGGLFAFGESSSSVAATNSSPGLNKPALTASGEELTKVNNPESSELDLSLKL